MANLLVAWLQINRERKVEGESENEGALRKAWILERNCFKLDSLNLKKIINSCLKAF